MPNSPEQELRENYISWTKQSLIEMRGHYQRLLEQPEDKRQPIHDDIFGIAHNIKGMGSSFGFPLMTEAGTSLCKYLRGLDGRVADVEVIDAHIKVFELVMGSLMEGDGGEGGAKLLDRLNVLTARSLEAA